MPDQKITDLTALTGAGAASGDLAVVVDVSDTTMAATGTDKKMTLTELSTAVTTLGALLTNPLPASVAGHAVQTWLYTGGAGAMRGSVTLVAPVGTFPGEVYVEGGDATADTGGGVYLIGGNTSDATKLGGSVYLDAGNSTGGGFGGNVRLTGGGGGGIGVNAVVTISGANSSTHGLIQVKTNNLFGTSGQALVSDGANFVVWGNPAPSFVSSAKWGVD